MDRLKEKVWKPMDLEKKNNGKPRILQVTPKISKDQIWQHKVFAGKGLEIKDFEKTALENQTF